MTPFSGLDFFILEKASQTIENQFLEMFSLGLERENGSK